MVSEDHHGAEANLPPTQDMAERRTSSYRKKRSSNRHSVSRNSTSSRTSTVAGADGGADGEMSVEEQLIRAKDQIAQEKAGKRKLFHSIVKLAEELSRVRSESTELIKRKQYAERTWYEGGMWRAPQVLPSLANHPHQSTSSPSAHFLPGTYANARRGQLHVRESISLTDLFFNLVIVTGFTRVGVAMSGQGEISFSSFCYFTIFFTVWSKQASYSTRFDTTDLSAQVTHLITCFAVLFASLSVQAPVGTSDANRIMAMAASVAILHCCLYGRVLMTAKTAADAAVADAAAGLSKESEAATAVLLARHVTQHAIMSMILTALEAFIWLYGIFGKPFDWQYRWVIFVAALIAAGVRIPRAFLANDFHASCSKRGVLFILLLGFLLQSVVVVASEFFSYQTPNLEHYAFIGAVCLLFFCIKLLYVNDDADTLAQDHALLVNRWAAFFFHIGQFSLLLSVTVLGSGLNLLTHSYLAATAALSGPEKSMVCGGFSGALLSTFFIKSMHVKRIPTDPGSRALFVAAYLVQTLVLLAVAGIAAVMSLGMTRPLGMLEYILANDIQLVFALAGSALFVTIMSWLDEGVELTLYESVEASRSYRVRPFGFWICCNRAAANVTSADEMHILRNELEQRRRSASTTSLSTVLSPLLAHSVSRDLQAYESVASSMQQQQQPRSRSSSRFVHMAGDDVV